MKFSGYLVLEKNKFREDFGLYFEEFEVGQKFKHRPGITISQQDNKEEALDTINHAQLHYDQHYANQTEWKKCLGVSTLTLQRVLGMTSKTCLRKIRIISYESIEMTHPVFDGDTLYAESEIVAKDSQDEELGRISLVTRGINQKKEEVAKIAYTLLISKRGKHHKNAKALTDKFASYRLASDGSFIEQFGLYYEDFIPGEIYEHQPGKSFTAEENRLHTLRSLEIHPQYSDSYYNQVHHNGQVLINENFLLGSVTALTTRTLGRVVANLGWKNIKLPLPVYAGDTIYATSEILDKRESNSRPSQGIMHVQTNAFNQKKELICSYERFFLIYKKGLGPYANAGY